MLSYFLITYYNQSNRIFITDCSVSINHLDKYVTGPGTLSWIQRFYESAGLESVVQMDTALLPVISFN